MVAIVVGLVVVAAGLWLTLGDDGSGMGAFGVLLLVIGAASLAANLFLRRRGFRMRRRRP